MTLIVTRTSGLYALMATDRKVTKDGVLFDPDANKNIIFGDKNAVVAIGYTGMAYIGSIPTDQWIVQTLTGLTFPEGPHGRGDLPTFSFVQYDVEYLGVRLRNLRDRLNDVRPLVLKKYRDQWTAHPFDLLITGWESNHGNNRPYLVALSKPRDSNLFEFCGFDRHWHRPRGGRFPVRMAAAPTENVSTDELRSVQRRLNSVWGDGHGTPDEQAAHAEELIAEIIQDVSARLSAVGPDVMSIRISSPAITDPTIRVRYIPAGRDQGIIVAGEKKTIVRVAFSPWVVSPGCIRSPAVFTNLVFESQCGPYRVVIEDPPAHGMPRIVSSQERPAIE